MTDMFPDITPFDDEGVSGWIKRNAADLVHWCTILAAIGFVVWTAVVLAIGFFGGGAAESANMAAESAKSAQTVARQEPPWWWTALLDGIKTITPLALPFITNYARKKFNADEE